MKVECINNNECEGTLKTGQQYLVQAEFKETYKIELNPGESGTFLKGRFKELEAI